MRVQIDYFEY